MEEWKDMIRIDTYFAKQDLIDFQEDLDDPEDFFINIKHPDAKETANNQMRKQGGNYIWGTIRIDIHGVEVVGFSEWDHVSAAWAFFLKLMLDYTETGNAMNDWFEESATTWSVKKAKSKPYNLVVFKRMKESGTITVVCEERAFLAAVLQAAQEYVDVTSDSMMPNKFLTEHECLIELKKRITYKKIL